MKISKKVSAIAKVRESRLLDPTVLLKQTSGPLESLIPVELSYIENRKYWRHTTSPLFDGGYYLAHNADVREADVNPLMHYIDHGFAEGRSPSSLVNVDHIIRQLVPSSVGMSADEFKLLKQETLKGYDGLYDLLSRTGCNPCFFFDNAFFAEQTKGLEFDAALLPVQRYFRLNGRHPHTGAYLECSPHVSMRVYMAHADLRLAGVMPLRHLIENGIGEGRKFHHFDVVNREFMNNTASLFCDDSLRTLDGFLRSGRGEVGLAGPNWHSPFHSHSIPALAHEAAVGRCRAFIGVVLYHNSEGELRRLQASIDNEIKNTEGYELDYCYLVNDPENFERYASIVDFARLVVPEGGNIGFGRGHNFLMQRCFETERLYIGANPDGYFAPGCVKALVDFDDFYGRNVLIEASALPIDHPKWHDPITFDTHWVSGACFALSRNLWGVLKGFDEQIHMYCEDVDMSWRAKLLGAQLKICPTARFVHDVTPRFSDKLDESVVASRRAAMLTGAYYLARKWGCAKRAEEAKAALFTCDLVNVNHLPEPAEIVDAVLASQVAEFTFSRYAPSRFWGT